MMGWLRRRARRTLAHGVDVVGRRWLRRHEQWPSPSLWEMTVNAHGNLCVRGHDLVAIADACGTPVHVVDEPALEGNFARFVGAFRQHYPRVEVACSYKTNPLPGVLRKLHAWGAWAEVISHFELWLALRLGVPSSRIVYNGPGKTRDALEVAVAHNIAVINIDGLGEISLIDELAEKHGVRQSVGIRVVASVGWSEQFGLPIRNGAAREAARRLRACSHVELTGLHLHLGTGISEIAGYLTAIREVAAFAAELRRELGIALTYLDLGGGFAAPTVQRFSAVDAILLEHGLPAWPADLGGPSFAERHAGDIMSALKSELATQSPVVIFEPGRAITGSAQCLLLTVLGRKDFGRDVPALILDGGRNVAMPPSWQYHAVIPVNRAASPGGRYYDVFGPLCHPGDLLFRGRWLPELETGDRLAIMDAGAYFIPNQMNFSNPRPAVVAVSPAGCDVIRARESFEDVVRLDELPAP